MSDQVTKLMHEVCPFRIGSRVKVKRTHRFAREWPGNYAVVGIFWDYQKGEGHEINIAIASDDDIRRRDGSTDGWRVNDLEPASGAEQPHGRDT